MQAPLGAHISLDGKFFRWGGVWRHNDNSGRKVTGPYLRATLEEEFQVFSRRYLHDIEIGRVHPGPFVVHDMDSKAVLEAKAKANMGCDSGPSYSDIVKSEPSALAGPPEHNVITHPKHYTNKVPPTDKHPNGIECYEVIMWFPTMVGSAIKYLWRAGDKDDELQDLRKAKQFIDFRIEQIEQQRKHAQPEPQRKEPA